MCACVMQDNLQVAIKKIPLKSVPGKLSSIRQEEISILKVKSREDACSGSISPGGCDCNGCLLLVMHVCVYQCVCV